jgi:NADP-dependent 3-hydroxy acid dehydrogenase YdfG
MNQLAGKITIITGAGTGIGKGIARAFAREGAKLVLASRNAERLEETQAELEPQGVQVLVVPTDVTDEPRYAACLKQPRTHSAGLTFSSITPAGLGGHLSCRWRRSRKYWR